MAARFTSSEPISIAAQMCRPSLSRGLLGRRHGAGTACRSGSEFEDLLTASRFAGRRGHTSPR